MNFEIMMLLLLLMMMMMMMMLMNMMMMMMMIRMMTVPLRKQSFLWSVQALAGAGGPMRGTDV